MFIGDEEVMGLDITTEEAYFRHAGCENCNNRLGNNVYECGCVTKSGEKYFIEMCHGCLCSYFNGDELPEGGENVYEI